MNHNENLTEALSVLAFLPSASQSTSAKDVGPFSCAQFRRVLFIIDVGALGSSATIDFKIQAATSSGGTYSDVSGTSITQVTAGASNLILVELKMETLATQNKGPFIKGVLTPGTAASQAGVVALGSVARYGPASDFDVVAVAQRVVA